MSCAWCNPRYVGIDDANFKDKDDKLFVEKIVNIATNKGSGWVDYKCSHSVTQQIL
jgi:hypothetical protein